jgi:tetratricopeptide (TPR) repeat protein
MTIHSFLRGFIGLALAVGVFGQGRPPSTGPGGNPNVPPPTGGPTRGNSPNFPGNFPDTTSPDQLQMPLYVSGKVVMDDGTPPPDRVAVQLVCQTQPRTIGYTDRKGYFSVDVNDRRATAQFQDASENDTGFGNGRNSPFGNNNRTRGGLANDLMGCDLQASLAGFRSDVSHLGVRRSLDNPDVGTIFLHRLSNVEGLTISATSALAPKDAIKALDKGRDDARKQKWQDAQKELNKAVSLYPKYAAAWYELGNVQREQKDIEGARQSYAKALEADPKFVSPYLQLGDLAGREQKWQETVDDTDRLLRLNPVDFPLAWYLNAVANFNLGKLDAAEKSAREGVSHDAAHHMPRINLLLGVILAQKRDYPGAAENLRNYLQYSPKAEDAEQVKKQLEDVEKVLGPEAKKQ